MTRTSPIAFCRRSATTSTSAPYHGSSSAANVEAPHHDASPPSRRERRPLGGQREPLNTSDAANGPPARRSPWGPDGLRSVAAASAGGLRLRSLRDSLPGVVPREVLLAPPARDDPLATALDAAGLVATLGQGAALPAGIVAAAIALPTVGGPLTSLVLARC